MKLGCCLMVVGRSEVSEPMADKSYPMFFRSSLGISSWLIVLEDCVVY